MASLMDGCLIQFILLYLKTLIQGPNIDSVQCKNKVIDNQCLSISFDLIKYSQINSIFEISSSVSNSQSSQSLYIDWFLHLLIFQKMTQNLFSWSKVRFWYLQDFIKSTWPKGCSIKTVWEIGCCNDEHIFVFDESVHFYKDLIQESRNNSILIHGSFASHWVKLVEENYRGRLFSCLLKKFFDFLNSWALVTFLQKTGWHILKVSIDLIGQGSGYECLTNSRRSDHEYSFWQLCSNGSEFLRIGHKIFDLF